MDPIPDAAVTAPHSFLTRGRYVIYPGACPRTVPHSSNRAPREQAVRCRVSVGNPLHALAVFVRPFELHRKAGHFLEAPGADVADLTVVVVIPARARDRIGNRFAEFV